jgi:hypothetical protein
MVRGTITKLVTTITAVAVALALAFGAAPAAAQAAPKAPPKPDALQLAGNGVEETILVEQGSRPKLFQMLLSEVNWLAQASASTSAVPKFVLSRARQSIWGRGGPSTSSASMIL